MADQQIRPIALGRKNWLFFGSDKGGRTAANLFSVTQSAKRHGLNIFRYIEDLLAHMPGSPMSKLSQWLPDEWLKRQNPPNPAPNSNPNLPPPSQEIQHPTGRLRKVN